MKSKKPALSKLFKGKDTYGEELKEAKAIKSGKISPQQYAKGEKMEEDKKPKAYAKGGKIKKMANGGRAPVPTATTRFRAANVMNSPSPMANLGATQQVAELPGGPVRPIPQAQQQRQASMQQQAANIAANQQVAANNRAAAAARFQQMAANTPRPMVNAPVQAPAPTGMKKGGCTKKAKGGCTKMARGGGVESRGKTRGKFV